MTTSGSWTQRGTGRPQTRPVQKLRIYGAAYAERAERAVPVQLLVRDAAASDTVREQFSSI